MILVEFISEIFESGDALWATCAINETDLSRLPQPLAKALKLKPYATHVEAYISEGPIDKRYVAVQVKSGKGSFKRTLEEAGASLSKIVAEGSENCLVLDMRGVESVLPDLLTGFFLAGWRFDKYRTASKEEKKIEKIFVLCDTPEAVKKAFQRDQAIIEGVLYARELTSEPPNILYPAAYADKLKDLKSLGIQVEVLNAQALQEIGMTALLSVGKGSSRESSVVIMTWNGLKDQSQPILIAGKGVCFDSGGVCLKLPSHQLEMKWDKAGAGVVAGLMRSLALQNASVNVVGIVGLVENMPDGNASKSGDVIHTMSGQTVEIVDTDCEGRLVLADCLWYGQERFNPKTMVDLGTLTLETVASLGRNYGGLYSNCPQLAKKLKDAGESTGELLWELPMGASFAKQIESPIADLRNAGVNFCGENGAAAEFLKRFVKDVSWAHIDIAGVAWTSEDLPLCPKGVTGYGVRLLEEWINSNRCEQP